MARKIARILLIIFGVALGPVLLMGVDALLRTFHFLTISQVFVPWAAMLIYIASGLSTGILFYFISPRLIDSFMAAVHGIERSLTQMPLSDIVLGIIGLLVGLIMATLLSTLTWKLPSIWISTPVTIAIYLALGQLGWTVALKRRGDINLLPNQLRRGKDRNSGASNSDRARPKVLDTSVIIDGRILDICATGLFEGTLVVPSFVLQELRHIADSADSLKRNRGRRGLDILNRMQKELDLRIKIDETDFEDVSEVDAKLLRLAEQLGGVVVTNDYNLNKVAAVQSVPVFNINELANAVKPVVLPGEEMRLLIVKDGKEQGQGIAYLDDGTMIVVDGAKKHVGAELDVVVTSVLQTSAGRMIFGKIK